MKDNTVYLKHILQSIELIEEFYNQYKKAKVSTSAIERQLEIIGEASNNLSDEFKTKYNKIPWRDIINMRNILIHNYRGINHKTMWQTVEEDIPFIKQQILDILKQEENI